jgi:hypothetical protein
MNPSVRDQTARCRANKLHLAAGRANPCPMEAAERRYVPPADIDAHRMNRTRRQSRFLLASVSENPIDRQAQSYRAGDSACVLIVADDSAPLSGAVMPLAANRSAGRALSSPADPKADFALVRSICGLPSAAPFGRLVPARPDSYGRSWLPAGSASATRLRVS